MQTFNVFLQTNSIPISQYPVTNIIPIRHYKWKLSTIMSEQIGSNTISTTAIKPCTRLWEANIRFDCARPSGWQSNRNFWLKSSKLKALYADFGWMQISLFELPTMCSDWEKIHIYIIIWYQKRLFELYQYNIYFHLLFLLKC